MNYVLLALGAALSTSLTTIFSKLGVKGVKSNFATFIKTGIVIIAAIIMCLITGGFDDFSKLTWLNVLYLTLSGLATGCSWLCYFKALSLANVNKVAPIDKSSFVLTTILYFIFFFSDTTNNGDTLTIVMLIVSNILMLVGTLLMIEKKDVESKEGKKWIIFAILSSVFASLVSLFVKLGLSGINSNLGTLLRTIIVFVFAGAIVLVKKDYKQEEKITGKTWIFLILSCIATGAAWLLEYAALNVEGANPVVVNSITKLSILLTMAFSFFVLKEKFSIKSIIGLIILTSSIVLIIVFGL